MDYHDKISKTSYCLDFGKMASFCIKKEFEDME